MSQTADEMALIEALRLNYREKLNEKKNINTAHCGDFYYIKDFLVDADVSDNKKTDEATADADATADKATADDATADKATADKATADEATADEAAEPPMNEENITYCIYDEPCSKKKMCGDCAADQFESERSEEAWENFRMDRTFTDYDDY